MMTFRQFSLGAALVFGFGLATACGRTDTADTGTAGRGKVSVHVSPLQLETVGGATYLIEVFAGDPTSGAELVVTLADITSGQFGNNRGSISYVAPCDASVPNNYVRLTLQELRTPDGSIIAPETWQNPTPVTRSAPCIENADTAVTFNLTIMRDAEQGFFDVAVHFSDIFCSAKFDCRAEDGVSPVDFLHNAEDVRDTTMILGFACTSGEGAPTFLHMSDAYIECTNGGQTTHHWISPAPPSGLEGNQGAVAPVFFQTALYFGDELLPGVDKCYWNMALGLSDDAPANCVLKLVATASDSTWATQTGASPADTMYPYIHYEIPFTDAEGALSCGKHAINDGSARVTTHYTTFAGTALPHERQCGMPTTITQKNRCGGTVDGIGETEAAFVDTPTGVSVAFGDAISKNYPMPSGLQLRSCCLNPCCAE